MCIRDRFKRLYEDNVLGRVTDEQYRMLSGDYTDEQRMLEEMCIRDRRAPVPCAAKVSSDFCNLGLRLASAGRSNPATGRKNTDARP